MQLFAIQGNMASRRRKYSDLWAQLNESDALMSLPGWVRRAGQGRGGASTTCALCKATCFGGASPWMRL